MTTLPEPHPPVPSAGFPRYAASNAAPDEHRPPHAAAAATATATASTTATATEDTGWCCPVCAVPVPHPLRPGRARVYCTNSCKQRAYRWRRRHRHEFSCTIPPERAHTYDSTHALRPSEDFTARHRRHLPDGRPRRLTACGTFAAAALDSTHRVSHTKFYVPASHRDPQVISDGVCRSCATLLGVPIEPLALIVHRVVARMFGPRSPQTSPGHRE